MADISKIQDEIAQDEAAHPIEIYQKDGAPYLADDGTPCTVDVLGSDAKRVQTARDAVQRRMLRMRSVKIEPGDIRKNRIDIAAAGVTGWRGWTNGAEPFPYTPENARALLSPEHILSQVEAAIEGHADFFANSSPT